MISKLGSKWCWIITWYSCWDSVSTVPAKVFHWYSTLLVKNMGDKLVTAENKH